MEGTKTFHIIRFEDIPQYRRKEICHSIVVWKVIPQKEYPNRIHITITGSLICYPGNIGMPTGSLNLIKFITDSVLSRCNARFVCFDLIFFLQTPMDWPEYVRIKLSDITQELIEEYNITQLV